MIDRKRLLEDLQALTRRLLDDLRQRADTDPATAKHLSAEYARAKAAGRTAAAFEAWREDPLTQGAVAWVLSCVFVRFLEDNGFLDARAGLPHRVLFGATTELRALAEGQREEHLRKNPAHADREYLLSVFEDVGRLPGARHLFDRRHNPALTLAPTADGAKELLRFFRSIEPETGETVHNFTDPAAETRFLGDLYQDLSEAARKTYALLQTPDFVESFLLDRTLTPAIEEFGYEKATLIDPACGSGHFLLGAFHRLARLWQANQPGLPGPAIAQKALAAVFGVDLNPFAAAIARFRLLVAALRQAGIARLVDAPDFSVNVAVGDSLLHGPVPGRASQDRQMFLVGEDPMGHLYETEDAEELRAILGRRYHAVVANPPYITVKDAGLSGKYRQRFHTCYRAYSLVCPFTERLLDLTLQPGPGGGGAAGYMGQIVSNAFMKREFGSKLIEEFLPRWDLTHVLDTSGAFIPGHGTPTAILLARGRPPVGSTVRAVMGIRGEPKPPTDPAKGLVWTEVVKLADQPGAKGEFVSTADVPRERLAKHPWSLGGGGAAELKTTLDEAREQVLCDLVDEIGFGAVTREDDVYLVSARAALRSGIAPAQLRPLIAGEGIRDWDIVDPCWAIWPYDPGSLASLDAPAVSRFLWRWKAQLSDRTAYGETQIERGLDWFEYSMFFRNRFRTPLAVAFAFVATHNHFVLDRGGKVFNRSAPIIKLPSGATEDDYLKLLGLLNSSAACFWMKQVFYPKSSAVGDISVEAGKPEDNRFEFAGTGLLDFPIPAGFTQSTDILTLSREIDRLVAELSKVQPNEIVQHWRPVGSTTSLAENLGAARDRDEVLRGRMVVLQEELDWECYKAFGLTAAGSDPVIASSTASARPGQRPFAWIEDAGPGDLDPLLRAAWEQRRDELALNPNIAAIETPVFKRLWRGQQGVFGHATRDFAGRVGDALRGWLLDRLERPDCWPSADLQSTTQLADRVRRDAGFLEVARLYTQRTDVDVEALVKELIIEEGVPNLAAFRYADSGLRKRALWEQTWALQRRKDRGEPVRETPVPPKYVDKDFVKPSYWSHRGKLDVPKEQFILYPGAERTVDPAPVCGWAGWDHLQRAKALSAYYEKVKANEGWPKERLVPLLAGLQELVPWLLQWHDEVDPEFGMGMGTYFAQYVDEEARLHGLTPDALSAWRPPAPTRKGKKKS